MSEEARYNKGQPAEVRYNGEQTRSGATSMLSVIFAQNNIGPWGGATATGVEGKIQPFKTLSFNFLTNYFVNIKFEQVRLLRSNQFVIWPYLQADQADLENKLCIRF